MRLYYVLAYGIKALIRCVNGKPEVSYHEDYDPNTQYLIVAPHRSLLDPVIIAIHTLPHPVRFLAKKELFHSKVVAWLFEKVGVIAIDREHPSPKALKEAVNELKKGTNNVGIFPTGSRYSTEIKEGAAVLAKMGKVDLLPVAYQGPIHIKDLFSRKKSHRVKFRVGQPISLPEGGKLTSEQVSQVEGQIAEALQAVDDWIDPDYVYDIEVAKKERQARKNKN